MASQNNKKPKLVRDSFTIPKAEFAAIETLKTRAIALGTSVKKSELLRAGLMTLQGLTDAAYKAALTAVPTLKTGRPTNTGKKAEVAKVPVSKPVAKPAVKPAVKPAAKVAAKAPAGKAVAQPAVRKVAARRPAAPRRPASSKPA